MSKIALLLKKTYVHPDFSQPYNYEMGFNLTDKDKHEAGKYYEKINMRRNLTIKVITQLVQMHILQIPHLSEMQKRAVFS